MKLIRSILAVLALVQLAIPAGAQIAITPHAVARLANQQVVAHPLLSLPQAGNIGFDMDPDSVVQSDGTEVLAATDSTSNANVCTAPAGNALVLKLKLPAANGHNVFRSNATYGTPGKFLDCGRPTNLVTPMSSAYSWAVMIVYRNATNADTAYSTLFGDIANKTGTGSAFGIQLGAGVNRVQFNTHDAKNGKTYSVGDPATNIHTYIYSGDAGADTAGTNGRMYLDGTMWAGGYPTKISSDTTDHLLIGAAIANHGTFSTANTIYNFAGDIVRVIVWTAPLSSAESWQADAWARTTYGKPLATAGMHYFVVFDGDSQTQGTGANSFDSSNANDQAFGDNSLPMKVAKSRGWSLGQFANVGKPSARVSTGNNNSLTLSGARDVDQWRSIVGLPIVLVWGEFYNEPTTGAAQATVNRTYCTARYVADPTIKMVTWTSLSSWSRDDANRTAFNDSMVSTPGDCGTIVPVHLDPIIGTFGQAGTVNLGVTFAFVDGKHLNGQSGTGTHATWVLPAIHR